MANHTTKYDYGWARIQSITPGRPYLIRSILFCASFVFVLGIMDGVTQWGNRAACPASAISQTKNVDGSVDCVLKIDRDPAKVTKKERAK